jgi:hypothetical protein
METNKKTIQINPELFKVNGGGTRKKQSKNPDKIRMKTEEKPKKMSTIKKNILKMIRNHQEERRKKKSTDTDNIFFVESLPTTTTNINTTEQFQNEFNQSLEYLSNLTKDVETKKQSYTIKQYPSTFSEPKYGCLKNGKLPTYRTWINQNQTQKKYPHLKSNLPVQPPIQNQPQLQPQIVIQNQSQSQPQSQPQPPIQPQLQPQLQPQPPIQPQLQPQPQLQNQKLNENIKLFSKIQQFERKKEQQEENQKINRWKYPKQKRTIRRTYYVGRSKVHPKVSVLVTNKTIRAKTTLKQQQLKQVPITEVKKYLLKHGFIKIGTSSPNDVLREMYESAQLICGEIKNHNPENLLYNYFNTPSSDF